jgi:hypothetical protein
VVKAVRQQFAATVIEVIPIADWPRRKEELLAEARERIRQERLAKVLSGQWISDPSRPVVPEEVWRAIPRGKIWQKIINGETLGPEDYWEQLHAKLERRGYFERFARDEAALLEKIRNIPSRPIPKFAWGKDEDGVMCLLQVGFWGEDEEPVLPPRPE